MTGEKYNEMGYCINCNKYTKVDHESRCEDCD